MRSRIVLHVVGVLTVLVAIVLGMLYYNGGAIQRNARDFWGDEYVPDSDGLPWDFPVSVLLPRGGPMISPALTPCFDEALPLLPMRHVDENTIEVLCGLLSGNYVVAVSRSDIGDEDVWNAINVNSK